MFEAVFDVLFPMALLAVPVMVSLGIARFVFGQDNVIWACKTAGGKVGAELAFFLRRLKDATYVLLCGDRTKALFAECDELRSMILAMEDSTEAIQKLQERVLTLELEQQKSEALST